MVRQMTQLFIQLVQSYLFLIALALGAGLIFADQASYLTPFATLFLQIIFFLTSLKLDPEKMLKEFRRLKVLFVVNILMLLIFPAVVFFIAKLTIPSMAIPLMLLAAMPTGMTAPLLAEVVGGRPGVALVLTLTTSLFAPITIPIVVSLFAETAVTVSALTMFWSLVKVIVIPFVLAQGVRHLLHHKIKATFFTFKPISLVLLGLLIAGVVAKQADVILQGFGTTIVTQLLVLFAFIGILLVVGYFVAYWRSRTDRVTVSVCLTFMNFTLAIFLAGSFFSDPSVLLASVLVIFPWTLMLLPFRAVVRRIGHIQ